MVIGGDVSHVIILVQGDSAVSIGTHDHTISALFLPDAEEGTQANCAFRGQGYSVHAWYLPHERQYMK